MSQWAGGGPNMRHLQKTGFPPGLPFPTPHSLDYRGSGRWWQWVLKEILGSKNNQSWLWRGKSWAHSEGLSADKPLAISTKLPTLPRSTAICNLMCLFGMPFNINFIPGKTKLETTKSISGTWIVRNFNLRVDVSLYSIYSKDRS